MKTASISELLDALAARGMELVPVVNINDDGETPRHIGLPRAQKPGLALAGFYSHIRDDRVQVIGETELEYMESLEEGQRSVAIRNYLKLRPVLIVVTKGLQLPEEFPIVAKEFGVPVFSSKESSAHLLNEVNGALIELVAPVESIHGGMVDVFGMGVALLGDSGIGKSEVALDLIVRGHRLVADDRIDVERIGTDLVGTSPEISQNFMEVRGLGILNVRDLYGVSAVRPRKKLELVVEMRQTNNDSELDRLGLNEYRYTILGIDVPKIILPVSPGRNLAVIIEVAVRNQLLRLQGVDSAREFIAKVDSAIQ